MTFRLDLWAAVGSAIRRGADGAVFLAFVLQIFPSLPLMSMHKSFLAASSALALVFSSLWLTGCVRDEQADVAELSRYTPENLSQELLLRYKASLGKPGAANKASAKAKEVAKGVRQADGEKEKAAEAKYGVDVHSRPPVAAEKGVTVEDLAKNIARKIKLVEGATPRAVLATLNKAVDADPDLSLADKDKLQEALSAALDK